MRSKSQGPKKKQEIEDDGMESLDIFSAYADQNMLSSRHQQNVLFGVKVFVTFLGAGVASYFSLYTPFFYQETIADSIQRIVEQVGLRPDDVLRKIVEKSLHLGFIGGFAIGATKISEFISPWISSDLIEKKANFTTQVENEVGKLKQIDGEVSYLQIVQPQMVLLKALGDHEFLNYQYNELLKLVTWAGPLFIMIDIAFACYDSRVRDNFVYSMGGAVVLIYELYKNNAVQQYEKSIKRKEIKRIVEIFQHTAVSVLCSQFTHNNLYRIRCRRPSLINSLKEFIFDSEAFSLELHLDESMLIKLINPDKLKKHKKLQLSKEKNTIEQGAQNKSASSGCDSTGVIVSMLDANEFLLKYDEVTSSKSKKKKKPKIKEPTPEWELRSNSDVRRHPKGVRSFRKGRETVEQEKDFGQLRKKLPKPVKVKKPYVEPEKLPWITNAEKFAKILADKKDVIIYLFGTAALSYMTSGGYKHFGDVDLVIFYNDDIEEYILPALQGCICLQKADKDFKGSFRLENQDYDVVALPKGRKKEFLNGLDHSHTRMLVPIYYPPGEQALVVMTKLTQTNMTCKILSVKPSIPGVVYPEDPFRIFRGLNCLLQGYSCDDELQEYFKDPNSLVADIKGLLPHRFYSGITKLFSGADSAKGLEVLYEYKILEKFLPNVNRVYEQVLYEFELLDKWVQEHKVDEVMEMRVALLLLRDFISQQNFNVQMPFIKRVEFYFIQLGKTILVPYRKEKDSNKENLPQDIIGLLWFWYCVDNKYINNEYKSVELYSVDIREKLAGLRDFFKTINHNSTLTPTIKM